MKFDFAKVQASEICDLRLFFQRTFSQKKLTIYELFACIKNGTPKQLFVAQFFPILLCYVSQDLVTNVSPRIVRGVTSGHNYGPGQGAFLNIELISEKCADYWIKGIEELSKDFPTKVNSSNLIYMYNSSII